MKKRILIGVYIVMLLVCFELVFNYVYNEIIIYRYKQADYFVSTAPLMVFNWNEPYVAYYNQGNIYYQKESYLDAIDAYERALAQNPPEEKECAIRINMALAMLATMEDFYQQPEYVEDCLVVLYGAREVLLEKGCATEAGDGHSAKAEQLREEIEAMIRELEQQQSESESEDSKESEDEKKTDSTEEKKTDSTEEKTEEDAFEEDVKKAIQEKQSKANQERQEGLQYYEDFDSDYNFDSDGRIW